MPPWLIFNLTHCFLYVECVQQRQAVTCGIATTALLLIAASSDWDLGWYAVAFGYTHAGVGTYTSTDFLSQAASCSHSQQQQITTLFVSLAVTEIDVKQKGTREHRLMQRKRAALHVRDRLYVRRAYMRVCVSMAPLSVTNKVSDTWWSDGEQTRTNSQVHTPPQHELANLLCRLIIQSIFGRTS